MRAIAGWLWVLALAAGCSPMESTFSAVGAAISAEKGAPPPAQDRRADAPDALQRRRIIHNASIDLLVEDMEPARDALLALMERCQGFVANSDTGNAPFTPRSGRWTVRVPVAKYQEFLDAARQLGELIHQRTDAEDVTEQFVDMEARLKNKRVEEERLQEHLKSSTGKLEDILAVERELSRVRGEIEQTQGRLQKLSNLTELSTITVSLRERRGYVPPESPAFRTTIGRTFLGSVEGLVEFGKGIVLFLVAILPWLPILAVVAFGFRWLARRWFKRWRDARDPAGFAPAAPIEIVPESTPKA